MRSRRGRVFRVAAIAMLASLGAVATPASAISASPSFTYQGGPYEQFELPSVGAVAAANNGNVWVGGQWADHGSSVGFVAQGHVGGFKAPIGLVGGGSATSTFTTSLARLSPTDIWAAGYFADSSDTYFNWFAHFNGTDW